LGDVSFSPEITEDVLQIALPGENSLLLATRSLSPWTTEGQHNPLRRQGKALAPTALPRQAFTHLSLSKLRQLKTSIIHSPKPWALSPNLIAPVFSPATSSYCSSLKLSCIQELWVQVLGMRGKKKSRK